MTGLPDDPSQAPTRITDAEAELATQILEPEHDRETAPWYRNRLLLALWVLLVALLFTLIIYGIVELSRGGEGTRVPAPTTTTTTTKPSSTSSTTTPSTTTEPPSTEPPPPETTEQSTEEAPPPPATNNPAPTSPPRRHHHWHLPHIF